MSTMLAVVAMVMTSAAAHAQITPDKVAAITVPIHATQATAMAVHDETGTLLVARQVNGQEFAAYKLDDKGMPAGEPVNVELPLPEGVERNQWVQDITLHPKLPVAYIWQDLSRVNINQKIDGPRAEFDHLVVYAIEGPAQLKQIGSYARGEAFTLGQSTGAIGVSEDGLRLFMPNVGSAIDNKGQVGYFDLEPDTGLPAKKPVPIPGTLDGYGLNKYELAVQHETINVGAFDRNLPSGLGWFAPTKDVAVFGSQNSFAAWDTTNRRASLGVSYLLSMGDTVHLAGHPDSQWLYGISLHSDRAACQRHAHGYPTLKPWSHVYGGRRFRSEPVIITSEKPGRAMAVGGNNSVHLIAFDKDWALTPSIIDLPADTAQVKALTWSEKFNKLYVPADNPAKADEEKGGE